MNPGDTTEPRASITLAPSGTLIWFLFPAASMRSPLIITTESSIGARPEPSISVAPVIAMTAGGVDSERKWPPEDVRVTKTAREEAMRIAIISNLCICVIPKGSVLATAELTHYRRFQWLTASYLPLCTPGVSAFLDHPDAFSGTLRTQRPLCLSFQLHCRALPDAGGHLPFPRDQA